MNSILSEIKSREARKAALTADLKALDGSPKKAAKIDTASVKRKVRAELREILEGWTEIFSADGQRGMLRALLTSRLVFTPDQDAKGVFYRFKGTGSFSPVLAGLTGSKMLQSRS